MLVSEYDEDHLIARFRELLPRGTRTLLPSGDDCALIAAPEGEFIVSTDLLVDALDFRRDWSTPREVGERAAAQNLADIAAMGGRVSGVVVGLTLPSDTEVDWLLDLVGGFASRVAEAGGEVVGGDLSAGPAFMMAVTVMGHCPSGVVTRAGARPGDVLALAGTLGRSGAGLALLTGGHVDPALHDEALPAPLREAVTIFRAPRPPLDAGVWAAEAGAHAMMDVSDGLARDAARIARASRVSLALDSALLAQDLTALAAPAAECGIDPLEWVLRGGEDHPLLAAFPSDVPVPEPFRPIGRVLEECEHAVTLDGAPVSGGWDHFAH